jgi:protein-disulfide isomerase
MDSAKGSVQQSNKMIPAAIVVSGLLIAGAMFFVSGGTGAGKSSAVPSAPGSRAGQQAAEQPSAQPGSSTVSVSVDDDAVLGSKDAPITVIEFSDYECPFCKRSFQQMLPSLKSEYIDTGKVQLVYRDFPLGFHDPLATKEAIAAECAREQGGDGVYFEYHDEIFNTTSSNGNGMTVKQLKEIASDLRLNTSTFDDCLDSGKYKKEVQKDIADGSAAGASGTPTYFIGKTTDEGVIVGTSVVGAQPFAVFQAEIERLLQE